MTTFRYNSSHVLRGLRAGLDSQLTLMETPLGGSVVITTPTVNDSVVSRSTSTSATNNFKLTSVSNAGSFQLYTTLTPTVCTVDSSGNVSGIMNGTCTIDVVHAPSRRGVSRPVLLSTSIATDTWQAWASGSLAAHIDSSIRAMISSKSPGTNTQAILTSSAGGASSPAYTRNSSIFTGSLSLAAISVYTTAQGSNIFPVVLISQNHIIAGHVGCSPGQQIVFKRDDGGYEVRTVVSQLELADTASSSFIGILDTPITTITPMSFLPSTWATYLPNVIQPNFVSTLPVLNKGFTAGDWVRILQFYAAPSAGPYRQMNVKKHTDILLSTWSSDIIGGDSNGPVFVPVNGVPALLHCMNFAGGGGFYPAQLTDIQAKMNSLGTGYTLSTVNLSGFNTY